MKRKKRKNPIAAALALHLIVLTSNNIEGRKSLREAKSKEEKESKAKKRSRKRKKRRIKRRRRRIKRKKMMAIKNKRRRRSLKIFSNRINDNTLKK